MENRSSDSPMLMPITLSLLGKSAIVTGGSRGIGAETALELARRGADVAIGYTSESSHESAKAVLKKVSDLGRKSTLIQIDLNRLDAGHAVVDATLRGLGTETIDILVNNAGTEHEAGKCTEIDLTCFERSDSFDARNPASRPRSLIIPNAPCRIFSVNLRAPMLLVKALLPHLPKRGGRIISISSTLARQPAAEMSLYASSKAALECMSRHWAAELGRQYNITSNIVQLGPVETHYYASRPETEKDALSELASAERRLGQTNDISEVVAFLASDAARWINGDTISTNGGITYL